MRAYTPLKRQNHLERLTKSPITRVCSNKGDNEKFENYVGGVEKELKMV
jgi:hypothetical protein